MSPAGLLSPDRLVLPPKMDDRSLFRYPPDYAVPELDSVFDWSAYPGAGGGFQGAVEMCNNNGACRKAEGVMRSEEHTSELQSLMRISYAVFCLKKKNKTITTYKQNIRQ